MSKPVVFFPGTLCDERLWMPCWRKLNIQDRRYIPLQWANTLKEMLSITEHTLANQKAHLVGFSMGGYIASLAAIKWPHLTASLTLISVTSEGLTEQEVKQRKAIISSINNKRYTTMGDSRLSKFLSKPNDLPEKQLTRQKTAETMQAMESDLGPSVLKYHLESTTPRASITQDLAELRCPIHVITGTDDPLIPANSLDKMQKSMSNAFFHHLPDSGHMLPLENTDEVSRYIHAAIDN
jgi:pimeloyl-ACP methyl ester carboxylesterase